MNFTPLSWLPAAWVGNRPRSRFLGWIALGLSLTVIWGCFGPSAPKVSSPEEAERVLLETVRPGLNAVENFVSDGEASRYTTDNIQEPLPDINSFPLYGATPSGSADEVYLEVLSSSEKANADRQNERWLIEVAEAFNQQRVAVAGKTVQVGIRQVPSGIATQLLAAGAIQPAGFSPSNELWIALLQEGGVTAVPVVERLVPNTAGFVVAKAAYDQLSQGGAVNFDRIVDAALSGQLTVGYPNPYTSSTSLNMLYHLLWRAAGRQATGEALTPQDLDSPQVNSVFTAFQDQVLITTTTTLDLQEIFIRDPDRLQAFPLEYQNYLSLVQLPGFESVQFVPFGIPHDNPLVGFPWNDATTAAALARFGAFATAEPMATLAATQGFVETPYLSQPDLPPAPDGAVLAAAQSYWKARKDGGRTVYLMVVVDTSGSMFGEPMEAMREGLRIATTSINGGNQVGLVTFSDRAVYRVPLAPFDQLQHQRLLAAIDTLEADGGTAMYDATLLGLAELMTRRQQDPEGRFFLLLLTDGEANRGYGFREIESLLRFSDIRIYPIAYGDVNQGELEAIAALRESTVKTGTPDNVRDLLRGLFQTNL